MVSFRYLAVACLLDTISAQSTSYVNQTKCNGKTYTYEELGGYGTIPGNARDKYGDTIGGIGSAIAMDVSSWTKLANGSYTGVLWTLPDRGWNTEGTLNYQSRVHKFGIVFTPQPNATVAKPSGKNLFFTYEDTVRFSGPDGTPTTGLDADGSGHLSFNGFPDLPVTTYTGDGFGNSGPGGKRIPVDSEGLVLDGSGGFWVSDEYAQGPYIYHFNSTGTMTAAIRPPDAIIPMRNGSESFSADSPYFYSNEDDDVSPADNPTGRNNNHGFEGLSISADGKTLYTLLQAATNQEGGLTSQTERYTRFLTYDISNISAPKYISESIVPLPLWTDPTAKASKNPKVAAQSEVHALPNGQFLVLARDSNSGNGQDSTQSIYRHIDVFDVSNATNIKGSTYDCATCAVASSAGVLKSAVKTASYCAWLDFNVNSQLQRFGAHNGGSTNSGLLNEKWESITVVPVDGQSGKDGEWYIFSLSDNDFITQNGYLNGGNFTYSDGSGYNLDNQALVFKVNLPT
ncbi:outer membrane autotransporter protein [Rutstroemia sp. NJR-2017a WRK4]|nr:outer membrane autotransporter protein [Rutstroemia sp. NJR-2017a WRK4]